MVGIPKTSLRLPKDADRKARIRAIVELMLGEIEATGYLNHDAFAVTIWEMPEFGPWFCEWDKVYDKRGRPHRVHRLHPEILKAFKRRTGNSIVWEKDNRAWRKRKSPLPESS